VANENISASEGKICLKGKLKMWVGVEGMFLELLSEEDELIGSLKISWYSTAKFVVQIDIIMHEVTAKCLLYHVGVYEDGEFQNS
jgi:hypothetical protein